MRTNERSIRTVGRLGGRTDGRTDVFVNYYYFQLNRWIMSRISILFISDFFLSDNFCWCCCCCRCCFCSVSRFAVASSRVCDCWMPIENCVVYSLLSLSVIAFIAFIFFSFLLSLVLVLWLTDTSNMHPTNVPI